MIDDTVVQDKEFSDSEINYLRLNGCIYTLDRVDTDKMIDVANEIKEYYVNKYDSLKSSLVDKISKELVDERDIHCEHIQSIANARSYAIPESLFGKPVIVYDGVLCECRLITYAPTEFLTYKEGLYPEIVLKFKDMFKDISENEYIIVTTKPLLNIPMLIGYSAKLNKLYSIDAKTYHTHSGYVICTGSHKASDFWKLSDEEFEQTINRVNTFSLANYHIYTKDGRDVGPSSHYVDIVSVKREEQELWTLK